MEASTGEKRLRVCMLAYSFYDTDARIIRYAEALAATGASVDAIVLRRQHQSAQETLNGVRVMRIQRRERNENGKFGYLLRLVEFFLRSMLVVTRRHLRDPYHLIHVHSVPDFEVFATAIAKLRGARIILDIHDLVPELYAAKFNVSMQSPAIRMLMLVEHWSTSYSDFVIAANDLWRERLAARSACGEKCLAFLNYPDLAVFRGDLRARDDNARFVMIYPGTLNWHQGVDIAVKAFSRIAEKAPRIEFQIYGEGPAKADIERLIRESRLDGRVSLHAPLPLREIAKVMADADLGIVPKRDDTFGGEAFSTKILEFMALGVPLLVAGTRIDRHYFDASILRFFTPGDDAALASAMLDAYYDRAESRRRAAKALDFVDGLSWSRKQGDYLALVRRLTACIAQSS